MKDDVFCAVYSIPYLSGDAFLFWGSMMEQKKKEIIAKTPKQQQKFCTRFQSLNA